MRPTRAGIGVAIVAIGCFLAGRIFGTVELFYLAGVSLAALLLGIAYSIASRLDLTVTRTANPTRLRAGTPARIDLSLSNRADRKTPVLRLQDHVQNSAGASLLLAPIASEDKAMVAYRLPTRGRGRLVVGPLDLTIGDPLGLTRSTVQASGRITLMIHPLLIDLGTLQATAGHDPTADQQPRRALANAGNEFFALRPYVSGDELRRVNWRASARTGELVVKQEELPRTGRVTVVLDTQSSSYSEAGFERAVSAALSILHAGWRGVDALRFSSTSGSGFSDIRSRAELDTIDEQLALVTCSKTASLIRTMDELGRVGRGGTLVVVTGEPITGLESALELARRRFGEIRMVLCADPGQAPRTRAGSIVHDGEADFALAWKSLNPSAKAPHRSSASGRTIATSTASTSTANTALDSTTLGSTALDSTALDNPAAASTLEQADAPG